MAGLGGKNWAFEEEVTSSDVNGFLADQVVMRFANSTARTAGFGGSGEPTLAEGMISYLDDANRVDYYNGSAWKPVSQILQVVSTNKLDTFTTTSATYTDITGLSATITPSSSLSKIFILAMVHTSLVTNDCGLRINGGNASTFIGDAASNRSRVAMAAQGQFNRPDTLTLSYLDSPNTTTATTYTVQVFALAGGTFFLNRGSTDNDSAGFFRTPSSITLIEVAG